MVFMNLGLLFMYEISLVRTMINKLCTILLLLDCWNLVSPALEEISDQNLKQLVAEYSDLVLQGKNSEQIYEIIKSSLQHVDQAGSLRFSRSKKSKNHEKIMSFLTGACAGFAFLVAGYGIFYLCVCNDQSGGQGDIPNNFHQKNNWCWMVSVLQGMYKLDSFKAWVKQKASEDLSIVIHEQEKDKIILAKLLDNCFEAMSASAKSRSVEDLKKQVDCADEIYDKLFDIQKKYEKYREIAPDSRRAFSSGSKFCEELADFLSANEYDFPCSITCDQKKQIYIQQRGGYGDARDNLFQWAYGYGDEKDFYDPLSLQEKKSLEKSGQIQTNQILFFGMEDADRDKGIKQEFSVGDKKYELKAIVLWGPGHIIADADHGKWYIFDSMKKKRVQLSDEQMQKIYAGERYGKYQPQVLCYEQKQ